MNISLENWIRNKLQEVEETHDYQVATDSVRAWIDIWKELKIDLKSLKVGDFLTANDVCEMDTGDEALIIGKKYPIIKINKKSLFIISEGDLYEHEFLLSDIDEFFTK